MNSIKVELVRLAYTNTEDFGSLLSDYNPSAYNDYEDKKETHGLAPNLHQFHWKHIFFLAHIAKSAAVS